MSDRTAQIARDTLETQIKIKLNLDGDYAASKIDTGVGFLDHMLDLFAKHSLIQLDVSCKGDTHIDDHHSVEDIGIALGEALKSALGDKAGINRYGDFLLAMDEALVLCALDISGRGGLFYDVSFSTEKIGTFDTELVEEFMNALAMNAGITLHLRMLSGTNSHHIAEGCFKALAHATKIAISYDTDPRAAGRVPSTKGKL